MKRRLEDGSLLRALAAGALLALAACGARDQHAQAVVGGDATRGPRLVQQYGCGSCHIIPGADGADGLLGPPLLHWRERAFIAGVLPNSPAYLMRWLMTPQAVVPGNAMPDMGVTQKDAADISAYLYTIR